MISFENFKIDSESPIYLQIIRHIKRGIASGAIEDGDEMPSRRMLSALLGINPNTVQKACRILEEEGILVSQTGAKSCVSVNEQIIADARSQLLEREVAAVICSLKESGMSKDEAFSILDRLWEKTQREGEE